NMWLRVGIGVLILGVGAFMLLGNNETSIEDPKTKGKLAKNDKLRDGPGFSKDREKTTDKTTSDDPGKQDPGKDESKKDPKKNSSETNENPEADDQAVRTWSLKPSLAKTDPKNLEQGRVLLVGGKRVVVNGRTSLFKVPYDDFPLFLPRGKFRISQGSDVQTISVGKSYGDHYYKQAKQLMDNDGEIDYERVVAQIVNELGHPKEAYLLNLLAHHYLKKKKYDAARRALFRALAIDPSFAPAHLNLAWVYMKKKLEKECEFELRITEDMDSTGTFGLERGIAEIRHGLSYTKRTPVKLDPERYQFTLKVDDPVIDACFLFAKFAKTPLDAISAQNNAALRLLKLGHFEQSQGLFLTALKTLSKQRPTVRGRLVATTIFANLARLYKAAKWAELREIPTMERVFPVKK
ncbi:MAG: hypothetical protein P1V97_02345, partial [Planctomycetota bacterium]|nr:hypothetical protein [Planctomycetota bacterium]